MAKKKPSGYILPPEVSDKRKCIKIYIPDDVYDRGAFWGALFELTFSYNWQHGTAEKQREVAEMWRQIWLEAYERSNGMDCCNEGSVLHRFNPETGRPEVSYDDGNHWVDDPADIQNQVPLYPPLVTDGGSKTKCDAATNASEHVNELITATGENLSTAGDVFTLAVGVAEAVLGLFLILVSAGALTAPVIAVATAIWAAGTAVFELGHDLYEAYWTTDKQDAILCALYCHIGEDGQFTESQYQGFRAKVKSQLPSSPALDIVMTAINAGGARGLSQMASYGNAALADCSSCECSNACGSAFSIATGNLIGRGDNYIDVEAVLVSGLYTANINTPDNTQCCHWDGHEVLSGTITDANQIWRECGSNDNSAGPLFGDHCLWLVYFDSSVPFSIRFKFLPC